MRIGAALLAAAAGALVVPGTAAAHGSHVALSRLGDAWRPTVPVLVVAAFLLVLFAQAFVRLRARGRTDHAGWPRALLFLAAVSIGTLALVSPLDAAGEQYLISAHMLQHVVIADAAPALALAALRGPLLFFLLPSRLLVVAARVRALRAVLRVALRARVAVTVWIGTFAAWHVPTAYDATLRHRWLHDLEHATLVLAGVLVWTQLIDPARRRELTLARRFLVAFAVFVAGQALAYVLIFSLTPLYPSYAAQSTRLFGLSPLLDQQLAGVVMMVEQLLALGIWAALTLRRSGSGSAWSDHDARAVPAAVQHRALVAAPQRAAHLSLAANGMTEQGQRDAVEPLRVAALEQDHIAGLDDLS
jgi:putative membrane protein